MDNNIVLDQKSKLIKNVQVNTLLSKDMLPFSKVKINEKYYIQAPNKLEQELLNDEGDKDFDYPLKVDLIEKENGRVKFKYLSQLIKLLKYFDVDIKVQKNIVKQFIGVSKIKIKQLLPKPQLFNRILNMITLYSQHEITKAFLQSYGQDQQETIETLKNEYNVFQDSIHKNIFNLQFLPCDFEEIEHQILNNQSTSISDKNKEDFLIWKQFLQIQGTRNINVFLPKYDLQEDLYTKSDQIQQFLNESINQYPSKEDIEKLQEMTELNREIDSFHIKDIKIKKKETKKIIVEMRNVNGKYRLATKDSNLKHIEYLFREQPTTNTLNYNTINAYKEIISLNRPLLCFYIDIKDLAYNIHYDLLEKLGLKQLGQYLKRRQVFHIDQQTKQKTQLYVKKGIFIGEVFTPSIVNIVCDTIKSLLELSFKNALIQLGFAFSDLHVFKFQDDYLIKVFDKEHMFYTTKQVVDYLKQFEDTSLSEKILEKVKKDLNVLGFEMNQEKVRVFLQRQKERKIWKLNNEGNLVLCDDFVILKQNMLDPNSQENKDIEIQTKYLNTLIQQFQNNQEYFDGYSELEQFVIFKIIARYIRALDRIDLVYKLKLKLIETHLKSKLKIKRKQIISTDY